MVAAAAGILLLAGNPHGGEHLRDLLAGQILWVGWAQIGAVAAVTVAVLVAVGCICADAAQKRGFAFYALFAVAVTASVQLVGVLLVFASLIAPAVATRALHGLQTLCRCLWCRRTGLRWGSAWFPWRRMCQQAPADRLHSGTAGCCRPGPVAPSRQRRLFCEVKFLLPLSEAEHGAVSRHHHSFRAARQRVALGGDGQVTLGNIVIKASARKVRRLYNEQILAGFAGGTADAFTLFERFEAKLEKHQGNLLRSAVELAKDWRTDRMLRRLEAMLAVADRDNSLVITGNGDVLEPELGIVAIGSGGAYAQSAARALLENTELAPAEIVKKSLEIAGDLCIYTNQNHLIEDARMNARDEPASQMTPAEIVSELDKHIVGQARAKRAVAIALRNRWRRAQVAEPLRAEITPKNILMIGPTGVGKTEIARRLARLANAPFIKIEATKFTEVGYVGRDVDTIIRDLAETAIKDAREAAMKAVRDRAMDAAEDRVLDVLLPPAQNAASARRRPRIPARARNSARSCAKANSTTRKSRSRWPRRRPRMEIFAPPGMEELTQQIQGMFQNMGGGKKQPRKMKIADALKVLADEEAARLINDEEVKAAALQNVEQNGIVFLDEIDKIASRSRNARRRCLAPGRAARPAAAGRGHDGVDQVRHDQDRPHPVHRQRRLPSGQAVRPDSRTAGALPDPRRTRFALGRATSSAS